MVPYKLCRNQALNIVSTLLLTTAGEDDMSTLLGLMHTAKMEDLELKNSVLRSLLHILRESHRTRTVFRKAGGFVYLVSVLISMEGCLSIEPKSPWNNGIIFLLIFIQIIHLDLIKNVILKLIKMKYSKQLKQF
jgi:hypothetical protein